MSLVKYILFPFKMVIYFYCLPIKILFKVISKGITDIALLFKNTRRQVKQQISSPDQFEDTDLYDFESVKKNWGIDEFKNNEAIKGYISYIILSTIPPLILIIYMVNTGSYHNLVDVFLIISLSIFILTVTITRYWKIWCVQHQRFVFFKDWLKGKDSLREGN